MEEADKFIRLTEDLLYAVNKKLESRDKKNRHEAFVGDDLFGGLVGYRRTWPSTISQTKKAVMHKLFFDRNSIVKVRHDSTELLVSIAHIANYLSDYQKKLVFIHHVKSVTSICQMIFSILTRTVWRNVHFSENLLASKKT